MSWSLPPRLTRSAPVILVFLTLAAAAAFAAVSHLVTRYRANQISRSHKLYEAGLADMNSGNSARAIDEFRAALTGDSGNSQYQLSLGRALRDAGHLDEAESYLETLWQKTPDDGPVNLALGRVAARRGSVDDSLRYYHNAMYGKWAADAEEHRRIARIELIEFLLQRGARREAESELIALDTFLPSDPSLHLQAAKLFMQAQDYPHALSEYEYVLRLDHGNLAAEAGAGEAAYQAGRYRTAQRYLQSAAGTNPLNENTRQLLQSSNLILETDPFVRRISDAERNRRIHQAFMKAGERLAHCAQVQSVDLNAEPSPQSAEQAAQSPASSTLPELYARWAQMKPKLASLRAAQETVLPDTIMDIAFQIEQQTAAGCGEPEGIDEALLLISRDRVAADQ